MKNNKLIPFSLLFITLAFLELFCIVKYSDIYYFPIGVGLTLLGSAYLLLTEIGAVITSIINKRENLDNPRPGELTSAEKEESLKLARAQYVLEKRMLNLLDERILTPEENMENLSSLVGEIVHAIKVSIKYNKDCVSRLSESISGGSISQSDFEQILTRIDLLTTKVKDGQLAMSAVNEQLLAIADLAKQLSAGEININKPVEVSNQPAFNSNTDLNKPVETSEIVSKNDMLEETPEIITETDTSVEDSITTTDTNAEISNSVEDSITTTDINAEISNSVEDSITIAETVTETVKADDDPNRQLSPEDIAALFAATNLELDPEPSAPAPKTAIEALSKSSPAPDATPVSDDPNKQLSPEDIAALFASMGQ